VTISDTEGRGKTVMSH